MSDWKKLAKRAGSKWGKAKEIKSEGGSSNPNVEDGRYIAQLMGMELGQSAGGRDQIARDFKIIEGESKGEKLRDYQGLDTDKGISFFMRDLERLGYEAPDSPEEAEPIVEEINREKPKIRITVKNNGDFQNVYIDKALSDAEVGDGTEEKAEAAGGEEVEIKVGMKVVATIDGKEVEGKVVKLLENVGKVKIEDEDGETHKVKVEDVALPEGEGTGKKSEEQDLEEMDRDELEEFIDDNDLDIDVDDKKLKDDDDDLREAIQEALDEKGDSKADPDDKPEKGSKKVAKKTGSLKKKR